MNVINTASRDFMNQEDLIKISIYADELYRLLSRNMDEIPDVPYKDMYMMLQVLIQVKWNAISVLKIGGK